MVITADTGVAGGVCVICTQQTQGVVAVWRRVVDAALDAAGIYPPRVVEGHFAVLCRFLFHVGVDAPADGRHRARNKAAGY